MQPKTRKITALTPEQEAELPAFRAEWLRIGLSTESIDRDHSRAAVTRLYEAAGQPAPTVMFFDSPAQCLLALAVIRENLGENLGENLWENLRANLGANLRANLGENLGENLWENLRANLGANLRANLGENLRANLRANLRENLWENLRANLEANLGANLRANLWANLRANLRENLWENLRANLGDNLRANLRANLYEYTYFWGAQDAPWLAFYDFGRRIGVEYAKDDHFSAYIDYAKSSGWMYAYPGLALVSDRPEIIRKDADNRLHSEVGPALRFRDGYSVHCWHGRNVPADWIEHRTTINPAEIISHENVEMRALGAEIIGWPRMLSELGCKVIDHDPDPIRGDLIELTLPGLPEPGLFLRAECPRNGLICEGVPRRNEIDGSAINTVRAAQAWRVYETQETFEYPEIRT